MTKKCLYKILTAISALCLFSACGGGSGANDGIIFEGQIFEGVGDTHTGSRIKHSEGESLEDLNVCALNVCVKTDNEGLFAFLVDESFKGGEVALFIDGHGISDAVAVDVPIGTRQVFFHLAHMADNSILLHHLEIDGIRVDPLDYTVNESHANTATEAQHDTTAVQTSHEHAESEAVHMHG